ncbi:hypothetical protein RJ639_031176, partial [Escallonia herrerae]
NINFVIFSDFFYNHQLKGATFSIFVIFTAVAKAAIRLAIVSSIYWNKKSTRCTQCVRTCPTDVLEMIPSNGCKTKQIAYVPRTEDYVCCKICESACPTDFLSVQHETTRSIGLAY